jgi:hypothetical protein
MIPKVIDKANPIEGNIAGIVPGQERAMHEVWKLPRKNISRFGDTVSSVPLR